MKNFVIKQSGFSIFELLAATAITVIMLGSVLHVTKEVFSGTSQLERFVADQTESTLSTQIIVRDFENLSPSFNNINLLDDSNNLFFDFYSDLPNSIEPAGGRSRTLTFDAESKFRGKAVLYLILTSSSAGPPIPYDPVAAYSISRPKGIEAGGLLYVGVNQFDWIKKQRPKFWTQKNILLFDTPTAIRPPEAVSIQDMTSIPPKSSIFLGYVPANLSSDIRLLADSELGGKYIQRTRAESRALTIDSPDIFFRTASPMGGGQVVIYVRSVKIVRYSLLGDAKDQNGQVLERAELVPEAGFTNKSLVASRVKKVIFKRPSVLDTRVSFQIEKSDEK